jgi:hypothetical protein
MGRLSLSGVGVLAILALATPIFAQHHDHEHGKIDFETSCAAKAQEQVRTGLALLHHMMYEQAEEVFLAASQADPECAMAYWGVAMSVVHPLWAERPTDDAHRKGREALDRARAAKHATQRELAYIDALDSFYRDWETTPYPAQLAGFEEGFRKLHEAYPDDVDAATFYALSHLATAPKADQTLSQQLHAGAMLEALHERAPEHPGTFHYLIHAYDHPRLAHRALEVARGYDKIAPDVPHALHMPSHIFVRLGYWQETIDWNIRSAAAALRQPIGGMTSGHYAHAKDYMIYGYLQRGEYAEARQAIERMEAVDDFQPWLATAYALAAMHPRYTLERGDWKAAAAITLPGAELYPWENYPAAESIVHFARGLGAARSGDPEAARAAIAELDAIHERLTAAGEAYWAILTDAQRRTVEAWIASPRANAKTPSHRWPKPPIWRIPSTSIPSRPAMSCPRGNSSARCCS